MAERSGENDNRLICKKCHLSWEYEPVTGVSLAMWQAHIERQRCPECGTYYTLTHLMPTHLWDPAWKPVGMP